MGIYLGKGKLYVSNKVRPCPLHGRCFRSVRAKKLWRKKHHRFTIGMRFYGVVSNFRIGPERIIL